MHLRLGLLTISLASWALGKVNPDPTYTNRWAVKVEGGERVVQRIARQLGYTYKGQLGHIEDYYELVMDDHEEVTKRDSNHLTRRLLNYDEVKWAKQQILSKYVFKNFRQDEDVDIDHKEDKLIKKVKNGAKSLFNNNQCRYNIFACIRFPFSFGKLFKRLRQGNLSHLGKFPTNPAPHSQLSTYKGPTKHIGLLSRKISAYEKYFNDPLWQKQWYVQDYRTTDIPVMDHNVVPVYKMGITGEGVTVAIVDTAVQYDHPDLKSNIDIEKSYDVCLDRPLKEAMPYIKISKTHGTKVAGIVAMTADNLKCGVGIAYNAKLAVIRKDCKRETEVDSSKIILQNFEMFDISSNSWGPEDNAGRVCALEELAREAYKKGTSEGRNGKGVIYVQSAGNGGLWGDVCSTDCIINQPYIIAITSANQLGKRSAYSEECTAIFATTYSGNLVRYKGKSLERTVATTTNGRCTKRFQGTSASCPVASGIIALTLQANRDLSYRDVMHIIARSAEVAPLADNLSWKRNGQGFWVSDEFGFGLMNAKNMVILAKNWISVPKKHTCVVTVIPENKEPLTWNRKVVVNFETEACSSSPGESVTYLEHLEVASLVEYPKRGDIIVHITSPAGTKSLLLGARSKDMDKDGLEGWPIMSVHTWGEDPRGKWTIEVKIANKPADKKAIGKVNKFTVRFHGMGERPSHLEQQRAYAAFRLPTGITEDGTKG